MTYQNKAYRPDAKPVTVLVVSISVRPNDYIGPDYGSATIRAPISGGNLPETLTREIEQAITDLLGRPSVSDADAAAVAAWQAEHGTDIG